MSYAEDLVASTTAEFANRTMSKMTKVMVAPQAQIESMNAELASLTEATAASAVSNVISEINSEVSAALPSETPAAVKSEISSIISSLPTLSADNVLSKAETHMRSIESSLKSEVNSIITSKITSVPEVKAALTIANIANNFVEAGVNMQSALTSATSLSGVLTTLGATSEAAAVASAISTVQSALALNPVTFAVDALSMMALSVVPIPALIQTNVTNLLSACVTPCFQSLFDFAGSMMPPLGDPLLEEDILSWSSFLVTFKVVYVKNLVDGGIPTVHLVQKVG